MESTAPAWHRQCSTGTSLAQAVLHHAELLAGLAGDRCLGRDWPRGERLPAALAQSHVLGVTGPPGTGKTSLCKALAQKLTIRLSSRYWA